MIVWSILLAQEPAATVDWITQVGLGGVAIVAVIAFLRGWVVTGRQYEEIRQERDEWRAMALRGTSLAEGATGVAEAAVTRAPMVRRPP